MLSADQFPDAPSVELPAESLLLHTTRRAESIRSEGLHASRMGESGPGVYFARSKRYAATIRGFDPERMETLQARAQHPLRMLDRTQPGGEEAFRSMEGTDYYHGAEQYRANMQRAGFHGVRYMSPGEKHAEYAVIDPKSVRVE